MKPMVFHWRYLWIGFFFVMAWTQAGGSAEAEYLCHGFVLSHALKKPLSDTEKRLVCGDPQATGSFSQQKSGQANGPTPGIAEAWKTIPLPQAKFLLTNFLQDRGYLHPQFKLNAEAEVYYVDLGEIMRVKSVSLRGGPPSLDIKRKRKIIGEPLTPEILEVIQKWVVHTLQTQGYGCPRVTTTANPLTGDIEVSVAAGDIQNAVKMDEEPIPGLMSGILKRYNAFRLGYPYNVDLSSITETRIMGINLVQDVHLTAKCEKDGVHITQSVIPGKPSFISLGAGVNTEGLFIGKASWRNSRLGEAASWTDLTLSVSEQEQRLAATMNWYFLSHPSRYFIRPLLELKHQNEVAFESGTIRGQIAPSTTWDNQWLGASLLIGPTLDKLRTYRGDGPRDSQFFSIESRLDVKSHDFEFYQINPQSGFSTTLIADFSDENIYSQVTVQRFHLQAEGLWNFKEYDPPLLVFGLRTGFATLLTAERAGPGTLLPPSYLEYLGGSTDLRGFSRKELPTNGWGALTSLYADFEVRLGKELPLGLEPFTFIDAGMLGSEPLSFDDSIYWSPGLGIRWSSPIGVFRTTFAHGYTSGVPGHFQFFLSYGEEF